MSIAMKEAKGADDLALFGGPKTISEPMPIYSTYGEEEKRAAMGVIESGVLSQFLGAWSPDFYGGPRVKAFEKEWSDFFRVKHSITVNSATSGLIAALGALDLEPGDEVICSPWTMSADAAAILVWNAIPVFADIERKTFNLCPTSIRKNLSGRTKAILVSDIFGQGAKLKEILQIARENGLKVIEDAAQSPGARYDDKYVGTLADIGIYSLNYHKHIHTGEGGVCVTNDPELAERMQLIRNHAEAVVAKKPVKNMGSLIGFNFRMGELEAALGSEQLKKLPSLAASRTRAGLRLSGGLRELDGLKVPSILPQSSHVFYVYPLVLDPRTLGVSRSRIVEALMAEGVPSVSEGYANLHLLPMFQQKVAYGHSHFPWKRGREESDVDYHKGICPVAEELHEKTLIRLAPCGHRYNDDDVDLIVKAFKKVWKRLEQLKENPS